MGGFTSFYLCFAQILLPSLNSADYYTATKTSLYSFPSDAAEM